MTDPANINLPDTTGQIARMGRQQYVAYLEQRAINEGKAALAQGDLQAAVETIKEYGPKLAKYREGLEIHEHTTGC